MSEISANRLFPFSRPRRNRKADWSRRLVREKELSINNLILSMVIHDRDEPNEPIPSMPGVFRHNLESAIKTAIEAQNLGIPMIAVFPHISASKKDDNGNEALNPEGIIPVSYTHLDVYKRQLQKRSRRESVLLAPSRALQSTPPTG